MNGVLPMVITGVCSIVFGIIGKIIWDWLIIKNKSSQDVTAVLLSAMSSDIKTLQTAVEKIPADVRDTMELVFERLRELDITTTSHHEKILNLEKHI